MSITNFFGYDNTKLTKPQKKKFMVDNYDLYNLYTVKQSKNYKLFVKEYNNTKVIRLTFNSIKLPFGIEKYEGKDIVNLEFVNHKTNNESHNNYSILKQTDKLFKKLYTSYQIDNFKYISKFSKIIEDVEGKEYVTSVKERPGKYDPLLRVHLRKNKGVVTAGIFSKDGHIIHQDDIKGEEVEVEIELGSLWTTNEKYGLVWYVNNITATNI